MFAHWLRSLRRMSGLTESVTRRRRAGKLPRLRRLEVERLEDRWVPSGNPTLSPSLPADTVNVAYNQTITADGGTGAVTLAVSNVANAIPGLTVPGSGTTSIAITGTPTASGTETFTVTATDSVGATATTNYAVTVNPAIALPATLPEGTVNVPYNQAFTASGTQNTFYANQVVSYVPGTIPNAGYDNPAAALGGLNPATGTFSGITYYMTPFDPAFAASDLVDVGAGGSLVLKLAQTASTNGYTIGVHTGFGLLDANYPAGTNTDPASYSNFWLRQADVQVSADGKNWIDLGTITFDNPSNYYAGSTTDPEGLSPGVGPLANPGQPFLGSLSSFNGLNWQQTLATLNGSAGGTWLNLSGVTGITGVNYIEFTVPNNPPIDPNTGYPEIMTLDAVVGTNSSASITANGGTGDVNLAVSNVQHAIPGLTIPGSGTNSVAITGTPTVAGTETFTLTATDAAGGTTTTNESITVNPVLTLPATLPADTINVAYNQTINAGGGTGTVTLAVSNIQNAIPGLNVPSTSANGLTITGTPTATGTETFTVTATDAVGSMTTANYAITVNPAIAQANLPAVQLPEPQSVGDNTTLGFSADTGNAIAVSDPGATSGTVETLYLQDFYGNLLVSNTAGLGSITGNGTALVTMTGTLTALNAALDGLRYAPPPFTYNFAEPLSATLVAPNNKSASASVAINVTFASRAPTVPGLQTVLGNSTLTLSAANGNGITLADPVASSTDIETAYLQTLWGTLHVSTVGADTAIAGNDTSLVTLTGPLAELNAALDGLRYTPAAFTYSYSDTLDVLLQANDGPMSSAVPISVIHANQAPTVALPGTQTVSAGATLAFSAASGTAISVGDADANGGRETVTLEATSGAGSLSLPSTPYLTFDFGNDSAPVGLFVTGNGSALVGLTGTLAQLNTALGGLSFTAAGSFSGTAWLSVLINDNGNSGVPSALSASASIAIDVGGVGAGGPSISGPTSQIISTPAMVPFTPAISVSDPAANGAISTLLLQANSGSLSVTNTSGLTSASGSGTKSLTLEGTVAALNSALQSLEYQAQTGANMDFVNVMFVVPSSTGSDTATLGISLTINITAIP